MRTCERAERTCTRLLRSLARQARRALLPELLALLLIGLSFAITGPSPAARAAAGDWPTFLATNARSGFNSAETTITPATAPNLKQHWTVKAGGSISAQPIEANGQIYWGSWDGYEHDTSLTGTQVWKTFIGKTVDTNTGCSPTSAGVASSAATATITLNGTPTPLVFVGGGNANIYGLNATTGQVVWQTRLGSSPNHFLWSSPVVFNGAVYIGVASFGDCPVVQGSLVQLNAQTGVILHTFNSVPAGCVGGGIWSSPTIDPTAGVVYVSTGNPGRCATAETTAPAIVALSAADLTVMSAWEVPSAAQKGDSDFGATPTLFTSGTGTSTRKMVGLINKNGTYYAFDRTALSAGPVWSVHLGNGGFASSAWDGRKLYVAGGSTTLNGTSCTATLSALNPANGGILWEDCITTGSVLSSVTAVPGLAVVGSSHTIIVASTTTGTILFQFVDPNGKGAVFNGPASISNGVLYQGNMDGILYAIGT